MKNITKSMLVLLVLAMSIFLMGCENLFGSDPDEDYVLTMQVYIDGAPASGDELDAIMVNQPYGTQFGHELKLTQEEFKNMLSDSGFPPETTVEEYIDLVETVALPGVTFSKINSSTMRMNMDSITINEEVRGIKFEGTGLDFIDSSTIQLLIESFAVELFPGVTGTFSNDGKTFTFTEPQELPSVIESAYMKIEENYLVIDFDAMP